MFIHVIFSLMFAAAAALLVKFFAPYACGSGVPEVIT
jgi:H+/Cl- antiporter ClcA